MGCGFAFGSLMSKIGFPSLVFDLEKVRGLSRLFKGLSEDDRDMHYVEADDIILQRRESLHRAAALGVNGRLIELQGVLRGVDIQDAGQRLAAVA